MKRTEFKLLIFHLFPVWYLANSRLNCFHHINMLVKRETTHEESLRVVGSLTPTAPKGSCCLCMGRGCGKRERKGGTRLPRRVKCSEMGGINTWTLQRGQERHPMFPERCPHHTLVGIMSKTLGMRWFRLYSGGEGQLCYWRSCRVQIWLQGVSRGLISGEHGQPPFRMTGSRRGRSHVTT